MLRKLVARGWLLKKQKLTLKPVAMNFGCYRGWLLKRLAHLEDISWRDWLLRRMVAKEIIC